MTTSSEFVGGVDFVSVPTRRCPLWPRSTARLWGCRARSTCRSATTPSSRPENLTLSLYNPESMGFEHHPNNNAIALHVDDSRDAARGGYFHGETIDSRVCHIAIFADPESNVLMLHHRYAPRVTQS